MRQAWASNACPNNHQKVTKDERQSSRQTNRQKREEQKTNTKVESIKGEEGKLLTKKEAAKIMGKESEKGQ